MPDDRLLPRTAEGYVDLDALEDLDPSRLPDDESVERASAMLRDARVEDPPSETWDDVLTHAFDPASALDTDLFVALGADEVEPSGEFVVGADNGADEVAESSSAVVDINDEADAGPASPSAQPRPSYLDDDTEDQFGHFEDPGPLIELPEDDPLEFETPADLDDFDDDD